MNLRINENTDWIRIFINEKLHLLINKNKLNGFQSWKYNGTEYCIEFHYENSTIFCSYDNEEMWTQILALFADRIFCVK